MSEKYKLLCNTYDRADYPLGKRVSDVYGEELTQEEVVKLLNAQQGTIQQLEEENEQLRKEKQKWVKECAEIYTPSKRPFRKVGGCK